MQVTPLSDDKLTEGNAHALLMRLRRALQEPFIERETEYARLLDCHPWEIKARIQEVCAKVERLESRIHDLTYRNAELSSALARAGIEEEAKA